MASGRPSSRAVTSATAAAFVAVVAKRIQQVTPGFLSHHERPSDGGRNQRGVDNGTEIDEEHAVGEPIRVVRGHLHRQPSLAGPSWSYEGDEPRLQEEAGNIS